MKKILFLLLWSVVAQVGIGQTAMQHYQRVFISLGGQSTHLLDLQFSPLVHSANEVYVQAGYEAKHLRSQWNADLSFATGSLAPSGLRDRTLYNTTEDIYGEIETDSFLVIGQTLTGILNLAYTYDFVASGPWALGAGLAVRDQLMYPSSFTNMGIMNAASLLFALQAKYVISDKHELGLRLSTPIMGFNTRFPYSGTVSQPNQTLFEAFFDQGTRFVFPDEYQQVMADVQYRYALSPHTSIGLGYQFMWQRYTHPVLLKSYANRLAFLIDFSF